MNTYYLNFRTNAPYKFTHIIQGSTFKLYLKYDQNKDRYYFDVYKLENSSFVLKAGSLFLTTGCDIFQQYKHLGIGSLYIIPKTDEYYQNVNSDNVIKVKTVNGVNVSYLMNIYGSYPGAETIKDFYFMLWEHN